MPRFMMFMIPNLSDEEYDKGPTAEAVGEMMKYNETLTQAGVLLALDGLHPPSKGARISLSGGKKTVTDGPFTEAKEIVGGFALMQVDSREELIALTRRFLEIAGDGESEIIEMYGGG